MQSVIEMLIIGVHLKFPLHKSFDMYVFKCKTYGYSAMLYCQWYVTHGQIKAIMDVLTASNYLDIFEWTNKIHVLIVIRFAINCFIHFQISNLYQREWQGNTHVDYYLSVQIFVKWWSKLKTKNQMLSILVLYDCIHISDLYSKLSHGCQIKISL